ncbi:uncharacterized protein LOC131841593 [Achroia grisella]|uniref:uncharacterized protein LOC131841593 n=1 Tax=Achroia grisella TaxID=688607 RepID=UPI0027D23274|nr:uncharacterized protein LOC131841593 [Achroia grisella]
MGIINTKECRRKVDEATSNTGLSNLRYVTIDKSKWKVFRRKQVVPAYPASFRPLRGCPCGSDRPCKQRITPKGITIHYPQKKKKFIAFGARLKSSRIEKGYSNNQRLPTKVKVIRQRKFPTWRLDRITYTSPYFRPHMVRSGPY